jgi:hypothetical protein
MTEGGRVGSEDDGIGVLSWRTVEADDGLVGRVASIASSPPTLSPLASFRWPRVVAAKSQRMG